MSECECECEYRFMRPRHTDIQFVTCMYIHVVGHVGLLVLVLTCRSFYMMPC